MSRHVHTFTALWTHFGPYGDQDVHLHRCMVDGCDRVLVGEGRSCDGDSASHRRMWMTESGLVARRSARTM